CVPSGSECPLSRSQPRAGRNLSRADARTIPAWHFWLVHTRCRGHLAQCSFNQACHGVGRYPPSGHVVFAPKPLSSGQNRKTEIEKRMPAALAIMHQEDAWDLRSIWLTILESRTLSRTSRALAKRFRQILKALSICGQLLKSWGLSATGILRENITVLQLSMVSRIW